jgi:MFS family permease
LLAMPLALIPTLQIASRVIARFGPRRVFAILLPVHGLAACGPFLATGQGTLFVALAAFGAMGAFMQVCLNVYAGRLEKQLDRLVMSRCHGFWALGLAMGSALAGLLAGSNPIWAVLGIAVISTIPGVIAARALPHLAGSEAAVTGKSSKRRINQIPLRLYAISGFAFSISMTEGAMADWAAVYLAERLPVGATYAGIAVTLYGTSLAAGRFVGDSLKRQLGAVGLARLTVGLAISGVLVLIMPLPLMFAYVGFVLIGLGASVGFPLGVSAVAALDDQFEAQNIALMSMLVICGFLIGPPLIGILGDVFTLRVGLAALIPGLVVSFVLSKQLQSQ